MKVTVLLATLLVAGCNQYFLEPYLGQLETAIPEDVHALVNLEWQKTENSCLASARQKIAVMRRHGYSPELVVIQLHDDPRTHAVVLLNGQIYDNGFLSDIPFDYRDLSFYGKRIHFEEAQ